MTKEECISKIRNLFREIIDNNLDITLEDIISIYEEVSKERYDTGREKEVR